MYPLVVCGAIVYCVCTRTAQAETFDSIAAPVNQQIEREIQQELERERWTINILVLGNGSNVFAKSVSEAICAPVGTLDVKRIGDNVTEYHCTIRSARSRAQSLQARLVVPDAALLERQPKLLRHMALLSRARNEQTVVFVADVMQAVEAAEAAPVVLRRGDPQSGAGLAALPLDVLPRIVAGLCVAEREALAQTCTLLHEAMRSDGRLLALSPERLARRIIASRAAASCNSRQPVPLQVVLTERPRLEAALAAEVRALTARGGAPPPDLLDFQALRDGPATRAARPYYERGRRPTSAGAREAAERLRAAEADLAEAQSAGLDAAEIDARAARAARSRSDRDALALPTGQLDDAQIAEAYCAGFVARLVAALERRIGAASGLRSSLCVHANWVNAARPMRSSYRFVGQAILCTALEQHTDLGLP